jgi:protein phosphatase
MAEPGQSRAIADRILASFAQILSLSPESISEIGVSIPIPTFAAAEVLEMSSRARDTFRQQESLLEVPVPVYIVGDLHGNLRDLLRILLFSGPPPANRFLFLGDYVDRGEYSIEIVTLLFALMCKYPGHVFLLRGNHEFSRMNATYGFKNEISSLYPAAADEIYERINSSFNFLPIAAVVGSDIFCVHGGITPQITNLRQIRQLIRPIETYDTALIGDLMWSDPGFDTKDYVRSDRGNGVIFGVAAVKEFTRSLKIGRIIRAHQVVDSGVEKFADDVCYTVFSCSHYQESFENRCGLIYITAREELQAFSLPMVKQLKRESALMSGPLLAAASIAPQVSQNTIRSAMMCMVRSESTDSGLAKLRVNKKATALGSAIRSRLTVDQIPLAARVHRPGSAEPGLPHL